MRFSDIIYITGLRGQSVQLVTEYFLKQSSLWATEFNIVKGGIGCEVLAWLLPDDKEQSCSSCLEGWNIVKTHEDQEKTGCLRLCETCRLLWGSLCQDNAKGPPAGSVGGQGAQLWQGNCLGRARANTNTTNDYKIGGINIC